MEVECDLRVPSPKGRKGYETRQPLRTGFETDGEDVFDLAGDPINLQAFNLTKELDRK
jgi:hypothetical protein